MKVSPAQIAKTFASTTTGTDVATQAVDSAVAARTPQQAAGELISYLKRTGRMADATTIVQLVQEELDRASGTLRASITTAQVADAATRTLLEAEVAREFPATTYEFAYQVDQELIGGYQIEAGGQLIDASVRRSLRSFSPTFS